MLAVCFALAALVLAGCGTGSDTSSPPPPADSSDTHDPTMAARTWQFLNQFKQCAYRAESALTQTGIAADFQEASDLIFGAKTACSNIHSNMYSMDTEHFADEALDAEVAVGWYEDALGSLLDYFDTQAPSSLSKAKQTLTQARGLKEQAVREINERRRVYGFGPV